VLFKQKIADNNELCRFGCQEIIELEEIYEESKKGISCSLLDYMASKKQGSV
jgi:hypothetical protein